MTAASTSKAQMAAPRCSTQRLATFSGMKAIGAQRNMRMEQRPIVASRQQPVRAGRRQAVIEAR